MTAQADARQDADGRKGVYVYGIVPGDVEVEPGATGVGDPPGEIRVVRHGDLAALVSDVDLDRPLGRAEDLFVHEELLDASAASLPVLPLRFGSVVTNDAAVADELLRPHAGEFAGALDQLEGRQEYVVKGRYVEQTVLAEILQADPRVAQLNEQIRDAHPDATRDQRLEIGELVSTAIEAMRQADTATLGNAVEGRVTASVLRPPSHELDAVYVAFLVEADKAEAVAQAVKQLADEWRDRIDLRLLGPLAAYDFVGTVAPAADAATRS